jgi:hypothetical protein
MAKRSTGRTEVDMTVSLEGDLDDWIERTINHAEEEVAQEVDVHAEKVKARAIELCPKKTGLLASTIHVKGTGSKIVKTVRTDHGKAPHDFLVHFGTPHAEGVDFLYQASDQLRSELVSGIDSRLNKGD